MAMGREGLVQSHTQTPIVGSKDGTEGRYQQYS